ncbi:MAG: TonB-dependent receptor [Prevotellaceae bacterium]|nr:TonB-dependent receptor [Candidatus Minthosoma equi]
MSCTNRLSQAIGLALLLCMLPIMVMAQQKITVKGTVSDTDGPLMSAAVKVKGQPQGTMTDMDGKYSITVQQGQTLEFSFMGYVPKEVKVGAKSTINVVLSSDEKLLSDVVVVGYGQMKRSDLTGAVVSVDSKAIEKSVPTSIDQVLQGRAAGVQIQANIGTPGGSTSIRIRGTNSINLTSQPIFVIDGVVIDTEISTGEEANNPLASINPSDIVSMDILKDASATAIYGSRASNGVIMITTKKGQSGDAKVTYDGYVGWQSLPKHLDVMNLREYAAHHNERSEAGIVQSSSTFVSPELLADGTDWQKELFKTAFMTSHNIGVSGGTEKVNYAINYGYMNQDGIALGSGFRRQTLRSNIDSQIKKWLKGGISFSLADVRQDVGTDQNNTIYNALRQQPSVAVTNATGSYDGPDDVYMPTNPVAMAEIHDNYYKKYNLRANGYFEATILPELKFKTEVSADYNFNNYYYYEPDYTFGVLESETRTSKWTKTNTKYWSWRNILTYDKVFAEKHALNVMLGQEMSHSHWEAQTSAASGFLSNSATDPSAGDVTASTGTGSQVNSSLFSYFGRAFYQYDERYLATFTLRRDGSSKFADGNRYGWFPSAALAWKLSNESFIKDSALGSVMNNAKLRLGWGNTGNQNVENWTYMALMSSRTTPWGVGVLNGNTANPDLKWETTTSYNIGLDLNFFQNRIEFIFDWYYKKTNDLLLQVPLPAFLGSSGSGAAANPWANVGSIRNKGVEMTLNTVNVDNGDFSWRTNVVFSANRNRVISLDTQGSTLPTTVQIGSDVTTVTNTMVGSRIGQFWGYKVIGRFDKPEDFYYKDANGSVKQVALPEGAKIEEGGVWLGDYRFADLNNDGKITDDDCTFIGDAEPKFTFGFGNTFSYKGFDLTVFFSGSYGNKVCNYARRWLENPSENSNLLSSVRNYAKVEKIDPNGPEDYRNYFVSNPNATMLPRLSNAKTNVNNRMSDRFIEDGSYFRLQNISLSYTFPKKLVQKLYLDNLKVYCNIQNLFTITGYDGFDPEVGSLYGNSLLNGVDFGRYPSPRVYTVGLNVAF